MLKPYVMQVETKSNYVVNDDDLEDLNLLEQNINLNIFEGTLCSICLKRNFV